ncbi:MAG: RDD family protein [Nocardioides sp.]|uniref:RDD family protein n=1 Tax=Nocardioides sp. TaxID=35761 RepID=UPI0039E580E8
MSHLVQAPPPTLVIAEPDCRFYAFVLDRLIGWLVLAAAAVGAWAWLFDRDRTLLGVLAVVLAVLVVWVVTALLVGLGGSTPGTSALGLRVLGAATGRPIGLGRALLRQAVLGILTLPTLGVGTAALAWMATMDPTGHRRGWHDRLAGSVVVDVRRRAVEPAPAEGEPAPRRIINLTAMRLLPAPAQPAPAQPTSARPGPPADPEPGSRVSTFTGSRPLVPSRRAPAPYAGPPPVTPPVAPRRPAPPAPVRPSSAGRVVRWRVSFDTGESFVVAGLALVGRDPEPGRDEQASHVVPLSSSDMSLSKTHAQFQVVPDGSLVVMDRGSTNGTTLVRQGAARPLGARRPTTLVDGDVVRFGDREMRVSREP